MPHVEILYNQMESRSIDAILIKKGLSKFYDAITQIRSTENWNLVVLKEWS